MKGISNIRCYFFTLFIYIYFSYFWVKFTYLKKMEVTCAGGAGSLKAGQSLLTHSALNTQRHIPLLQPRSLDVQASNSTSLLLKVELLNFSQFHDLESCASFEEEVKPGFFSLSNIYSCNCSSLSPFQIIFYIIILFWHWLVFSHDQWTNIQRPR